MQDLLDKARSLGKEIAAHERVKAFVTAQKAVQTDQEAQSLLRDYQAQVERMHELEVARKPIEVDDKRKLADIETKMSTNAFVRQMMRTQADYVELMNQINQCMAAPLAAEPQPRQPH